LVVLFGENGYVSLLEGADRGVDPLVYLDPDVEEVLFQEMQWAKEKGLRPEFFLTREEKLAIARSNRTGER
jgi:hypothetical protein